ncbi:MAG: TetR/AcrR family transcriptional regulator [Rubrivivax sp.]|jgi:AcrR family transcriptional regulator
MAPRASGSSRSPTRRVGGRPDRPPLSRERIECEALALIEREGLEAFSTRRLGEALGVEAMSLYHHFPSKAHVLDALVDRVLSGIPIPDRHMEPAARLRQLVHHWREMARRHARFYPWLALHRWNSATGVAFLSEILAALHDAGLDDERAARGFRALGYYVLGATLDETQGYAQGPSALQPLTPDALQARHPQVAAAGRFFTEDQFESTFRLGLDVLLHGLGMAPPTAPAPTRARRKP